jgi:hypothetical protein
MALSVRPSRVNVRDKRRRAAHAARRTQPTRLTLRLTAVALEAVHWLNFQKDLT